MVHYLNPKKQIIKNLEKANIQKKQNLKKIASNVLGNYGRIFAEYVHLEDFRNNKLNKYISIEGNEHLNDLKKSKKKLFLFQVILIILNSWQWK